MSALPDNLTDDDRLLLHLAGELPEAAAPAVQSAVRKRLDSDAAARQLADLFARVDGPLRADAARESANAVVGPFAALAAARAVSGAMRSMEKPAVAARRRWRPPVWAAYPAAAAVLLAGLMGGWWYQVRDEYGRPVEFHTDPGPTMLVLRGNYVDKIEDQDDFSVSQQFDSMIVDRGYDPDNLDRRLASQLAGLDYLSRVTR